VDCIEPCDGFHPSQPLQQLYAGAVWDWLEKQHPDVLGPVNPFNEAIDTRFGTQGGY
jgi:hypothetical protein